MDLLLPKKEEMNLLHAGLLGGEGLKLTSVVIKG